MRKHLSSIIGLMWILAWNAMIIYFLWKLVDTGRGTNTVLVFLVFDILLNITLSLTVKFGTVSIWKKKQAIYAEQVRLLNDARLIIERAVFSPADRTDYAAAVAVWNRQHEAYRQNKAKMEEADHA